MQLFLHGTRNLRDFLKNRWFMGGAALTLVTVLCLILLWSVERPDQTAEPLRTLLFVPMVLSQFGIALMLFGIFDQLRTKIKETVEKPSSKASDTP